MKRLFKRLLICKIFLFTFILTPKIMLEWSIWLPEKKPAKSRNSVVEENFPVYSSTARESIRRKNLNILQEIENVVEQRKRFYYNANKLIYWKLDKLVQTSNHARHFCSRVYCLLHGIRQDCRDSCAIHEDEKLFGDAMPDSKYYGLARFLCRKPFSKSAVFERRNAEWLSPCTLLLHDNFRVRRR